MKRWLVAALLAVLATRASDMAVVWVKHDFSWDGPLARWIARRCRQVVGVSEAVIRTFGPSSDSRMSVVPSGVSVDPIDRGRARRVVLELLGCEADAAVIALAGRVTPVRGQLELLEAAGMPPGVINFVPGDPAAISNSVLSHRDLAGVHFTGSTAVFNSMWKTIGAANSGAVLVSVAWSVSLVLAPLTALKARLARSSSSPDRSIATTVLSNVGASGLLAIAVTSRFCSAIPASSAGK